MSNHWTSQVQPQPSSRSSCSSRVLPSEILEQILILIPPSALLITFRSVSRQFKDLIDTSPTLLYLTWRRHEAPASFRISQPKQHAIDPQNPTLATRSDIPHFELHPLFIGLLQQCWRRCNIYKLKQEKAANPSKWSKLAFWEPVLDSFKNPLDLSNFKPHMGRCKSHYRASKQRMFPDDPQPWAFRPVPNGELLKDFNVTMRIEAFREYSWGQDKVVFKEFKALDSNEEVEARARDTGGSSANILSKAVSAFDLSSLNLPRELLDRRNETLPTGIRSNKSMLQGYPLDELLDELCEDLWMYRALITTESQTMGGRDGTAHTLAEWYIVKFWFEVRGRDNRKPDPEARTVGDTNFRLKLRLKEPWDVIVQEYGPLKDAWHWQMLERVGGQD